jgi:hypothetical protein
VLRVRLWSGVAWFASSWCLPVGMLVDYLTYQSQYAAYNIPYYDLSWLRRCQPPSNLLYALNEFCRIPSLELANYAQQ